MLAFAAGCSVGGVGSTAKPAPQGPPAERHGVAAVADLTRAEEIRARLTAVNELARTGDTPAGLPHVRAAREAYAALSPRVRRQDRRLDAEVRAAFAQAEDLLGRRAPFDAVERAVGALRGQLLQGALTALVPLRVQDDAGVRAQVLLNLLGRLPTAYGRAGAGDTAGREAFGEAFGLMVRAQTVSFSIADFLGPARKRVLETLSEARKRAFPRGPAAIARPPAEGLRADAQRVQADVARRFGLQPPG